MGSAANYVPKNCQNDFDWKPMVFSVIEGMHLAWSIWNVFDKETFSSYRQQSEVDYKVFRFSSPPLGIIWVAFSFPGYKKTPCNASKPKDFENIFRPEVEAMTTFNNSMRNSMKIFLLVVFLHDFPDVFSVTSGLSSWSKGKGTKQLEQPLSDLICPSFPKLSVECEERVDEEVHKGKKLNNLKPY